MEPFVKFENVKKIYKMGEVSIEALKDATFEIEKGEICVIVGPSGAGTAKHPGRNGYFNFRQGLA